CRARHGRGDRCPRRAAVRRGSGRGGGAAPRHQRRLLRRVAAAARGHGARARHHARALLVRPAATRRRGLHGRRLVGDDRTGDARQGAPCRRTSRGNHRRDRGRGRRPPSTHPDRSPASAPRAGRDRRADRPRRPLARAGGAPQPALPATALLVGALLVDARSRVSVGWLVGPLGAGAALALGVLLLPPGRLIAWIEPTFTGLGLDALVRPTGLLLAAVLSGMAL